jgi:hypothetical protein
MSLTMDIQYKIVNIIIDILNDPAKIFGKYNGVLMLYSKVINNDYVPPRHIIIDLLSAPCALNKISNNGCIDELKDYNVNDISKAINLINLSNTIFTWNVNINHYIIISNTDDITIYENVHPKAIANIVISYLNTPCYEFQYNQRKYNENGCLMLYQNDKIHPDLQNYTIEEINDSIPYILEKINNTNYKLYLNANELYIKLFYKQIHQGTILP